MKSNLSQYLQKVSSLLNTWIALVLMIIALAANLGFYWSHNDAKELEAEVSERKREATSGFTHAYAKEFFYFYYYTDHFPLATLNNDLEYSTERAAEEINSNGEDLIMEYKHWSRLGEHARIGAYYPHVWSGGSLKELSIIPFNAWVFSFSILILLLAFFEIKRTWVGFLIALVIINTDYFIYEVFFNENVFSLLGSSFFLITALSLKPILKESSLKRLILVTLAMGIWVGFFSQIRNELTVVFICALFFTIFFKTKFLWYWRVVPIISLLFGFYITKNSIQSYFDAKYETTHRLVTEKNGHPYNGKRIEGHRFWHPVFCGLGDYDTKYGYEWNDRVAYYYATPILNSKYGLAVDYSGKLHLDQYYDADSLYYVKFDEIDAYEEIMKDKVISDITNDPFWYVNILLKRLQASFKDTLPLNNMWIWFVLAIGISLFSKRWSYLYLLLGSFITLATVILIYSGNGATYNGMYGYMSIIILAMLFHDAFVHRKV